MLDSVAMIGPETALIVLVAVLVLFGGKKIPELMRGVGQGVGELRRGMDEGQRQILNAARVEEEKKAEAAATPTPVPTPAPTVTSTTTPIG
jgi:sec-independent protein translocase protein TatA